VRPAAFYALLDNDFGARIPQSPPGAVPFNTRLYYALDGRSFRDSLALGAATNVEARATDEFRNGVRRFLARHGGSP
jgi:hypothetical protein